MPVFRNIRARFFSQGQCDSQSDLSIAMALTEREEEKEVTVVMV